MRNRIKSLEPDDDPPLTKAQIKELERRLADSLDPTRYVIVSSFGPTFSLFYQPSDGNFVMNEIPENALFKRKLEALCVAKAIDGRRGKKGRSLQVIKVKQTKKGVRILESVHAWGRAWRPKLRRRPRPIA